MSYRRVVDVTQFKVESQAVFKCPLLEIVWMNPRVITLRKRSTDLFGAIRAFVVVHRCDEHM